MKLLNAINEKGLERSMKLNAKKTKVIHIGKAVFQPVIIEEEELKKVHNFRYLGSIKSDSGHYTKAITSRIAMIKPKTIDLKNIWKVKNLSNKLNIKILKAIVWITMMDGVEMWTLRNADRQKIELWFYRRLLENNNNAQMTAY